MRPAEECWSDRCILVHAGASAVSFRMVSAEAEAEALCTFVTPSSMEPASYCSWTGWTRTDGGGRIALPPTE